MASTLHRAVTAAFAAHTAYPRTINNTSTDGVTLYLHGNAIAEWRKGKLYVSTAGWNTVTTRQRLNMLPGVHAHNSRRVLYLNDKVWNGQWAQA